MRFDLGGLYACSEFGGFPTYLLGHILTVSSQIISGPNFDQDRFDRWSFSMKTALFAGLASGSMADSIYENDGSENLLLSLL